MELSEKQKEIVQTKESKVVVISSAASGKTRVLTERVKYLLDNNIDPRKIVVITFTNAAAEELLKRLGNPKKLFIGTIHSYANYLLKSFCLETSEILENEQFDRLFPMIKKNPKCIKQVEHLLLDEAQDSTDIQFEFLLDMIRPMNYMFVGDYRQSIYGWAGSDPDLLINLSKSDGVTKYYLNENYRNSSNILDYAKGIIKLAGLDYIDYSIPRRENKGKVINMDYDASKIARAIKNYPSEYKDWFILTRTNSQIDEIIRELEKEGVPYDTFKRSQLDSQGLNEKLEQNTVKVLTIHTSKGLENKNVLVIGAKFFNREEKCISYVAATRARDLLVWTNIKKKHPKKKQTYIDYEEENWERWD